MIEAPNLSNLNGLVELGNRDGIDIRPTLLRVMTDLYVQKKQHTKQEDQHFTELMLRLIDLVDDKTRAIVAHKIAGCPTAPAAVRHRLLKEVISIKVPELSNAEAGPFGGTPAAPADDLSELFFAATAEERRLILLNLPYALLPPAEPITPAIAREATHRLEAAALGHNSEQFARELERIFAISLTQTRRLYEDESGEPIVVVAAALDMPAMMLQRILLCLSPMISQSVQRVYELALLHEEIEPDAALRLIAIWQTSHPAASKFSPARSAAAHQPLYSQGKKDERSAPALPVTRPKVAWDELKKKRQAEGA